MDAAEAVCSSSTMEWLPPLAAGRSAASAASCSFAAAGPPFSRAASTLAAASAAHPAASATAAAHRRRPAASRGICSSGAARHTGEPAPAPTSRPYERTCWQCGHVLGGHDLFFCPSCDSVQPASMDSQYFQVFGMEQPEYDLDTAQLEAQYRGLQRRLHPDKYTRASSLEQEYAHQQAAVVNQAYDVLKNPLRRAHYILNQQGYGACEGMTITDPELLMHVMEAREEVEEAGSDRARLQPLLDRMVALKQQLVQELVGAFRSSDLHHAAELTTQLRYVCRIKEAILEKI